MIFDHINHIDCYKGIHPRIFRGLQLLQTVDFSTMELGRYEVEGDDLFYMVQAYTTRPNDGQGEAHKKYVDIQCILAGQEQIGLERLNDQSIPVDGRPDGDIWFYKIGGDTITLNPNQFAVLWPQDIHGPGFCVGTPSDCRKVVIKVKIAE